jgi:hypothetical protein
MKRTRNFKDDVLRPAKIGKRRREGDEEKANPKKIFRVRCQRKKLMKLTILPLAHWTRAAT